MSTNAPTNFLSLPSELRNRVYELALLHQEYIHPWSMYNETQELAIGLLRTSKTIHHEASPLFYAQNRFDFTARPFEDVKSFLEQIGSKNSACIEHIRVDFPEICIRDFCTPEVEFEEHTIGLFDHIRSSCTDVKRLVTSLNSTNAMENELDDLRRESKPTFTDKTIELADACFRGIASLQEIVVEVYVDEHGWKRPVREVMREHGWTINETEYVKEDEMDRDWSDEEYDRSESDDCEDYDDEYDIDNDSDFWRRAGD